MDSSFADVPLQRVKGIGPQRAAFFGRIGVTTVRDALFYLPRRYEDRSLICPIAGLRDRTPGTVRGRILSCSLTGPRRKGLRIVEILVNDGTGTVKGRWFNQSFMQNNLKTGQEVFLCGEAKRDPYFSEGFVMDSPEYETASEGGDSCIHMNRVVPIYPLTEGISQKQFRKIMFGIVGRYAAELAETLPPEVVKRYGFPALRETIRALHFPDACDTECWNERKSVYHERLAFEELFVFELGMAALRGRRGQRGHSFRSEGRLRKKLEESLPFGLTNAQKKALGEILSDMGRPSPMSRLLQGDVGCGKTVVALLAMFEAVECGFQSVFMAPTEVLAEQHYRNICGMAERMGVAVAFISGSKKDGPMDSISSGKVPVVVGTHALIRESLSFDNLGLVVIDEQHKFGVAQRGRLREKGSDPDLLVMTATPIPRSLALTIYGDLDYSVIDEMPAGRRPVHTEVVMPDQKKIIYGILEEEIEKGRQAYVIYPTIEGSEKADLRAAVGGQKAFEKIFPRYRVGLMHGRMAAEEREMVMSAFARGEIDILVSTTVVEVGLDVPNATLMIVVHAERFGLAQLHQLRGRVGRSGERSRCLLVAYGPPGQDAERRLDVMVRNSDGFRIAQEDLAMRGPGEFLGTLQSGMTGFRVADLTRDLQLVETAKREAFAMVGANPVLRGFPLLRKSCEAFWKGRKEITGAG